MAAIPERSPIGDPFNGVVLQVEQKQALALEPQAGLETITSGAFVIRYAVPYLGKPHLSIVPGLVALDYGDMLTGEEAWHFLLKRSNLHPRADILGYRSDGKDEMVTVKTLDLAQPVYVFVYTDLNATLPTAQPTAFIGNTTGVPERILEYLTQYNSVTDWQTDHE